MTHPLDDGNRHDRESEECPSYGTPDYARQHPEPPREGHQEIEWTPLRGCFTSVRVRDHTCAQLPISYELCAAGGRLHFRRTERTSAGVVVSESPPFRTHTAALVMWQHLLHGDAR